MKKLEFAVVALIVLALGFAGIATAAGRPDVTPGSGQDHWLNPENARNADNGEVVYRCGTDERGPKLSEPTRAQIDRFIAENRIASGSVIPVNFHVIYSSSVAGSNVSDAVLAQQLQVLNYNYAGLYYDGVTPTGYNTGYTFVMGAATTRTVASGKQKNWFTMTPGSAAETNAKNALAVNWLNSLNLYTCKPGQNLLGWATFPSDIGVNKQKDGVVIHYGSLPGGYLAPYNLGGTATHEVGHWVGLYHTFQGGCGTSSCTTTGDLVCDTPAQSTATSGCPTGKNTCAAAGDDPIHNYMDYSDDDCYNNFTHDQDTRADLQMGMFRPSIYPRTANGASGVKAAREIGGGASLVARPNPFNPRTKIEFRLPREGRVTLRAYDIQGRLVSTLANGRMNAGSHTVEFNGDKLSSGVYMMRLQTSDGLSIDRRITLLK